MRMKLNYEHDLNIMTLIINDDTSVQFKLIIIYISGIQWLYVIKIRCPKHNNDDARRSLARRTRCTVINSTRQQQHDNEVRLGTVVAVTVEVGSVSPNIQFHALC